MITLRAPRTWIGKVAATGIVYAATMAGAILLAAECKVFTLDVPDTDTLRLEDGEHVVASARTDKGLLEAKVVVRARKASAAQYYIGGKVMRPMPEERVPADIQKCLGIGQRGAASSPVDWLGHAGRTIRDFIEPPLEAFKCRTSCSCSQTTCCCLAICGSGRGVGIRHVGQLDSIEIESAEHPGRPTDAAVALLYGDRLNRA